MKVNEDCWNKLDTSVIVYPTQIDKPFGDMKLNEKWMVKMDEFSCWQEGGNQTPIQSANVESFVQAARNAD